MSTSKPTTLTELLRAGLAATVRTVSLRSVARESGVPAPVLSRFVRGRQSLMLPYVEKLCAFLGITHKMQLPKRRAARKPQGRERG